MKQMINQKVRTGDLQGGVDSPGINQVYGTDGAGVVGFKADPGGGAHGDINTVPTSSATGTAGAAGGIFTVEGTGIATLQIRVNFGAGLQLIAQSSLTAGTTNTITAYVPPNKPYSGSGGTRYLFYPF